LASSVLGRLPLLTTPPLRPLVMSAPASPISRTFPLAMFSTSVAGAKRPRLDTRAQRGGWTAAETHARRPARDQLV
jgi:hypothetical protein